MNRNLILAGLMLIFGVGEALADPPSLVPPPNPYCDEQPDISSLQAEFNAYNDAAYASALEAKGVVRTTMKLKRNSLTYDPDAKERTPWKVTTVNGDRVLPGEVIHSDCGPSAPTVHFGTKRGRSYRLEVTRPAVMTKSLTRCGCPNYSGMCGEYSPSSDQPLWVLPDGVKYGGVLEIEAPQKVLDIKLNVSRRCPGPPA